MAWVMRALTPSPAAFGGCPLPLSRPAGEGEGGPHPTPASLPSPTLWERGGGGGFAAGGGVRAHHFRQPPEFLLAAGEERVAGEGEVGAGRQVAGEGDLGAQAGDLGGPQGHPVAVADDDDGAGDVALDGQEALDEGPVQRGRFLLHQKLPPPQPGQDFPQHGGLLPLLLPEVVDGLGDDGQGEVLQGGDGAQERVGVEAGGGLPLGGGEGRQVARQRLPQGPLHAGGVQRGGEVRQRGLDGGEVGKPQGQRAAQGGVGAVGLDVFLGAPGGFQQLARGLGGAQGGVQAGLEFRAAGLSQRVPGRLHKLLPQPGPGLVLEEGHQKANQVSGQVCSHIPPHVSRFTFHVLRTACSVLRTPCYGVGVPSAWRQRWTPSWALGSFGSIWSAASKRG